jgi:hypothetical protein
VGRGDRVEVFLLGSSAGITAVGLLAIPASSIIAKAPIDRVQCICMPPM